MLKKSGLLVAVVVGVVSVVLALASANTRTLEAEKRLADLERRVKASAEQTRQPGPDNPFPIFPAYPKHQIDDEVDLWHKRLTYKTQDEPRRRR
jgi:hypothetical protein